MITAILFVLTASLVITLVLIWSGFVATRREYDRVMDSTLFDYVAARRTDPATSHAAAKSIKHRVSEVRQAVLLYALERPEGFTDWEMCSHFGNHSATYRTRRSELTDRGEIVPTLERRATPSGRTAVVWVHKSFRKEAA